MGKAARCNQPDRCVHECLNDTQDIYSKATPETQRAMNKSFQTSGGTVLSTNWDEVWTDGLRRRSFGLLLMLML